MNYFFPIVSIMNWIYYNYFRIIKITEKSESKLVAIDKPLEGLAGGEGIFFQLVFDKKNAVLETTSMMPGYDKPKIRKMNCKKY